MFLAGLLGGFGWPALMLFGYAAIICIIMPLLFIVAWIKGDLGE